MKRRVTMWHGFDDGMFDDLIKLVGCYTEDDPEAPRGVAIWYDGSLDDFAARWKRHFIVYPEFIAVTQHSNFGQR